ncbi:hypothetical protein HYT32_02195 [Candidatus Roizmanbacteria bacterium]|nr:hypothetical protein [Candidatus Roizmanbacteria bacterium]
MDTKLNSNKTANISQLTYSICWGLLINLLIFVPTFARILALIMGIKESFSNFGKGIKQRLFPATRNTQETQQLEVLREELSERVIQATLSELYVDSEVSRSEQILGIGRIRRTSSIENPRLIAFLNEMHRQDAEISDHFRTTALKNITSEALSVIEDPSKRIEIQINALTAAKNFWEETLRGQDKAFDVINLGKKRIEELSKEIDNLTNPDSNQKEKTSS